MSKEKEKEEIDHLKAEIKGLHKVIKELLDYMKVEHIKFKKIKVQGKDDPSDVHND